ncbi:MAG: hypothetical protein WBO07_07035 [Formosimonas sp.]
MNITKRIGCTLLIMLLTACGASKEKSSGSVSEPTTVTTDASKTSATSAEFKTSFIQSCVVGFKEASTKKTFEDSQVNAFCECGYTKGFENYSDTEIMALGLRMMASGGELPDEVQEKMKTVIPACLATSFK